MLLEQVFFFLLVVKIILTLLLSLPYVNTAMVRVVAETSMFDNSGKFLKPYAAILVALFGDCIRVIYSLEPTSNSTGFNSYDTQLFMAKFSAYQIFFNIFLLLVLRQYYQFVKESHRQSRKTAVVVKQAEGQKSAYMKLVDENKELKEKLGEVSDEATVAKSKVKNNEAVLKQSKSQSDEYMRVLDELAATKEMLQEAEAARAKAEKQMSAIKSQAESQSDQYMTALAEIESLKGQLKDFDLVMGSASKKLM